MLRDEHEVILSVLDVLDRLLARDDLAAVSTELGRCVEFFRLYADACHHGKEEDLLFDALVQRGFSRESGPVAVMLEEHRRGRGHVRGMADAHARMTAGDEAAQAELRREGRGYLDLMRGHILKENHALFDMADQSIDEPACRRLCDAYDVACSGRFDGRSREELERLARALDAETGF
jgi:hemerythrin-like domain-containing protein